ncbi:hypothetical protein CU048_13940 [Beijerinckiaceae bacterium]|nr:hypothetical protein CU048_13940 [Beijerinckiaceae bacterium]
MDLAKYLAILQRRSLFFPRATLLGDPFEGSSTKPMVAAREYIIKNKTSDPALVAYKDVPDHIIDMGYVWKKMVGTHLVCCWHMNEHESAGMWNLYLRSNEGVCIQSTYRRLRSCLPQCVFIGEVNYIDYETEGFSASNGFNFIVHKRKSFEHERELRAVFWEVDGTPDAQPYKMKIEPAGLSIEVDLLSLIETVHISPAAETWLARVIQDVTTKYDLHIPILQSALAESPLY